MYNKYILKKLLVPGSEGEQHDCYVKKGEKNLCQTKISLCPIFAWGEIVLFNTHVWILTAV